MKNPFNLNLNSLFNHGVPEWKGDPKNLPARGKPFTFQGETFTWKPCNCGNPHCKRPEAYQGSKMNPIMTLRLRGTDTGDPTINIAVKVLGTEATIAILESDEPSPKVALMRIVHLNAISERDPRKYLIEKGVTPEDVEAAIFSEIMSI